MQREVRSRRWEEERWKWVTKEKEEERVGRSVTREGGGGLM